MTVTATNQGKWKYYVSDATGTSNILSDLITAIDNDGIPAHKVMLIDVTSKCAVVHHG